MSLHWERLDMSVLIITVIKRKFNPDIMVIINVTRLKIRKYRAAALKLSDFTKNNHSYEKKGKRHRDSVLPKRRQLCASHNTVNYILSHDHAFHCYSSIQEHHIYTQCQCFTTGD